MTPASVRVRWQTSQLTPARSTASSALPSTGRPCPCTYEVGDWQRRHHCPMPSTSWFATLSAAWYSGSRMALAIIVADQLSHGMYVLVAPTAALEWHSSQVLGP